MRNISRQILGDVGLACCALGSAPPNDGSESILNTLQSTVLVISTNSDAVKEK